ncbi:hypothetical protein MIMGU_mgv1a022451mg [Erythranthe guttata]|uniref:Morc S5 domain-containing protein n=1 Tax=Erythranthe guttata TaxID=4155 RepID=A0A022QNS5_ERYGU|nr:hypothetical protein MIMGU_mgv1a022451mg [Erythranthe guttata]
MSNYIKQEPSESSSDMFMKKNRSRQTISLISIGSSSSDSDEDEFGTQLNPNKKQRVEAVLPAGFLDPIRPEKPTAAAPPITAGNAMVPVREEINNVSAAAAEKGKRAAVTTNTAAVVRNCKQFWRAGDYEGISNGGDVSLADMDHVRVHPRFLHSNATSHKWALGAFAELLDNALDEVCNGATYVNVDMVMKANTKMLVVQDNGGGMTPDKMRQCMSLGYSAKSKMANTIGQYGNGFKTSSMRLGADVIVFSRCRGKYGLSTTQSIGLLSFTFLQNTGKEDIIVPIVDYEKTGETWNKRLKSSDECWQRNLETVVQWSPYDSEEELVGQFNFLEDQGTRIVIYNLWEDDEGLLELDFEADQNDIQTRAGNRDDKKLMTIANDHPSSRRFLTYRHSLRSYASILYRRIPPGFSIILRGKEVEYHDIVDDLIHPQKHVYKPMSAAVTLGFIKDAGHHIDVQGFNVYHKNRLIRPFWRLWNASGSDGRGVIGVLEANFVEPAHDKQGFERTTALSRLEARLIHLQKTYWSTNCHLIGYAQRRHSKKPVSPEKEEASPPNADDKSNSTHNTTSAPKWNGKKGQKSSPVVRERNRFEAQPAIEDVNKAGPTPPFSSLTEMVLKLMDENRNLRNRYSN